MTSILLSFVPIKFETYKIESNTVKINNPTLFGTYVLSLARIESQYLW